MAEAKEQYSTTKDMVDVITVTASEPRLQSQHSLGLTVLARTEMHKKTPKLLFELSQQKVQIQVNGSLM